MSHIISVEAPILVVFKRFHDRNTYPGSLNYGISSYLPLSSFGSGLFVIKQFVGIH